jgi:hypothetical protein
MYPDILLSSKKRSIVLFSTWGLSGQTNPILENEGSPLGCEWEYNLASLPGLQGDHI